MFPPEDFDSVDDNVDDMLLDRHDEDSRTAKQNEDSVFDDKLEREFWRAQMEADHQDIVETDPITGELYVVDDEDDRRD